MSIQRGQWSRVLALDERIRRGEYPNCSAFAEEWEVSRRTVLRDIEFLRDRLNAPIEYDAERRGFFYSNPSWRMPGLDLTEAELLQLAVMQRLAAQHRGTPLGRTLDGLFDKLRRALPDRVHVDPLHVQAQFSFHGGATRVVSEKTWLALARAVRERHVVHARYRAYGHAKAVPMTLEPLHLACVEGEWYLVARRASDGGLRHMAVSRFESARLSSKTFTAPPFDPDAYFSNRFGRFVGAPGQAQEVSIRFEPAAAEGIAEREWHPQQALQRHRDGSVTLSFPAPSLYIVKRWVAQWGDEARVLSPPELVTLVHGRPTRGRRR